MKKEVKVFSTRYDESPSRVWQKCVWLREITYQLFLVGWKRKTLRKRENLASTGFYFIFFHRV